MIIMNTFFTKKISLNLALVLIMQACFLFVGCDSKKNSEVDVNTKFTKIYDNQHFSDSYLPIDVQQNSDGSYIFLCRTRTSTSSFYGIYIMLADKNGTFVSEQLLGADFVSPLNKLMKVGQYYYFICMNSLTLNTRLMQVSEAGVVQEVTQINGVIYPLAVSVDESGLFVLQHYDRDDKKTLISKISTSGAITASNEFSVSYGDLDIEQIVIDHLTGNGKQLPFLTGSLGNGTYFFNGYYNYSLSTVFFSFGNNGKGVLQGYNNERCISSMLYLGANKFAISRYGYGDNYIITNASISSANGAVASSSDITGNNILQMEPDALVVLQQISINGKSTLLYGFNTKDNQIGIYAYDAASGSFLGSTYLGYSNPYKIANFVATQDNGLAVAGTVEVSGRFPRVCLFKLSPDDLTALISGGKTTGQ